MGEVSARVGDACTAAAALGRRHRRHIKVPLFWWFAWRRDWGREHRLGRAFHWRRDPRAADAHTGAAQIAERPCHVNLSGFGKAKVIRESTKRCVITGAHTYKPLMDTGLGPGPPTRPPRLLLLDRRRRPELEGAHARAAGCGSRATPRRARACASLRGARRSPPPPEARPRWRGAPLHSAAAARQPRIASTTPLRHALAAGPRLAAAGQPRRAAARGRRCRPPRLAAPALTRLPSRPRPRT
mmetsp:Transcript_19374/g.60526  ORF Transcript_19374/g.60526 Transcript_19374/m.60526 type:complete len:242 (-) Transcript_19374:225-950(-)